ncbi:unnamed protein product [Natator depressus]
MVSFSPIAQWSKLQGVGSPFKREAEEMGLADTSPLSAATECNIWERKGSHRHCQPLQDNSTIEQGWAKYGPMTLGHIQRQQIKELCTSFVLMFSATPGQTKWAYHSIDTGNARSIRAQPYRVSPQAKTAIERKIQDMLQMGVICPSNSAWAFPVVLVPKPDGEIRFCVDYHKLNVVTRPDNY